MTPTNLDNLKPNYPKESPMDIVDQLMWHVLALVIVIGTITMWRWLI